MVGFVLMVSYRIKSAGGRLGRDGKLAARRHYLGLLGPECDYRRVLVHEDSVIENVYILYKSLKSFILLILWIWDSCDSVRFLTFGL
jgi:hypothetical protein